MNCFCFFVISTLIVNVKGFSNNIGPSRPNILLITADDMSADFEPFSTGQETAPVPNLKKLIEDSTVYMNAYIQFPVCGPSRASFLTGRYPDSIKNFNFVEKVDNIITQPKFFKDNGYVSAMFGKNFHRPYMDLRSQKKEKK